MPDEGRKPRGREGKNPIISNKRHSNQEIVTIAVFLLGGASVPVDTEDVAMKANEIAPGRFTWRKYKSQVNIEAVRKRLWDAKRLESINGSERSGWTVTQRGLRLAKELHPKLDQVRFSEGRLSLKEKQWRAAERRRLLGSEAFKYFRMNGEKGVKMQEAQAFFRLDDYVIGELRERKILRILDAFSGDKQLGQAVTQLAEIVRQEDNS